MPGMLQEQGCRSWDAPGVITVFLGAGTRRLGCSGNSNEVPGMLPEQCWGTQAPALGKRRVSVGAGSSPLRVRLLRGCGSRHRTQLPSFYLLSFE